MFDTFPAVLPIAVYPSGTISTTTTPVAVFGPLFVRDNVKSTTSPTFGVSSLIDLINSRSITEE